MRIECIAIGTELLTTGRLDTNSLWIADRLSRMGLSLHRKSVVGDDLEDMQTLFREASLRSDLVICTGGLGPTFDDLTKETWAEVLEDPLVEDPRVREDILDFYRARQHIPPESNFKQAMVPSQAQALRNGAGTAPGIYWPGTRSRPQCRVLLLPGVPLEMKQLWEQQFEPLLAPLAQQQVLTLRVVVGSTAESALDERTRPLRARHAQLSWTILASITHVELVARSSDPAALELARQDLQTLLGPDLVCAGNGSIEETVLDLLRSRGESLAVAESVTGGLIAARLTAIPGASQVFLGSAVAYSAPGKLSLLELPEELIQTHGTVSEATTRAMAEAVRRRLGSTWGLATTGNAGPTEDPLGPGALGTVFMAVAGPQNTKSIHYTFPGARSDIQSRTAAWGMDLLRRSLL